MPAAHSCITAEGVLIDDVTRHAGGHDSGKSTVIRALAGSDNSNTSSIGSRKNKGKAPATPEQDAPDLGMNFQYIDLADDGESGEGVFRIRLTYRVC